MTAGAARKADAGRQREQRDQPHAERRLAMNRRRSRRRHRARHLGLERRGDRHRQQPVGSTKNVKALKYAAASPEPGSARLRITTTTRPGWRRRTRASTPTARAAVRTAGWRDSKTGRKRRPARRTARRAAQRHRGDADRGAETERPAQAVVVEHVGRAPTPSGARQRQQRDDDDHVGQRSGSTPRRRSAAGCSGTRWRAR